ncbi:MAG TPA: metallothionein [Candidatus Limnocylindria bacterium]|nr:metallothionein [Candidatus Limnocylindria bacterium]
MADQKCAHSGCNCILEPGKGVSKDGKSYCTDHCANGGTVGSGKCQCGHPGCH